MGWGWRWVWGGRRVREEDRFGERDGLEEGDWLGMEMGLGRETG